MVIASLVTNVLKTQSLAFVIGIAALIIMMPQSIVATAGAVLHAANAADAAAAGVALPVADVAKLLPTGYGSYGR